MSVKTIINFKANRSLKDAVNIVAAKKCGGNASQWLINIVTQDVDIQRELRAIKRNATMLQR